MSESKEKETISDDEKKVQNEKLSPN